MKATRKLTISILSLAVAVAMSVTATFAWFTQGNEARITSFKLGVTTQNDVEVSFDGVNWGNVLDLASLKYKDADDADKELAKFVELDALTPASSDEMTDNTWTGFTLVEADKDMPITVLESAPGAGDNYKVASVMSDYTAGAPKEGARYLEFPLYFRSESEYVMYLNNSYRTHVSTATEFKSLGQNVDVVEDFEYNGQTIKAGSEITAYAADAARMFTVSESEATPTKFLYEPNSNVGFNGTSMAYTNEVPAPDTITVGSLNMAHEFFKHKTSEGINERYLTADTSYTGAPAKQTVVVADFANGTAPTIGTTPGDDTALTKTTGKMVTLLDEATVENLDDVKATTYDTDFLYAGKVMVYIWLEGSDADCFEAIYQDSLEVRLSFLGATV